MYEIKKAHMMVIKPGSKKMHQRGIAIDTVLKTTYIRLEHSTYLSIHASISNENEIKKNKHMFIFFLPAAPETRRVIKSSPIRASMDWQPLPNYLV